MFIAIAVAVDYRVRVSFIKSETLTLWVIIIKLKLWR